MKQGRRITVSAIVLGVVLANTGLLHAIHLLLWNNHRGVCESARPCWRQQEGAGHDSQTCTICTQVASAKKVLAGFATPISLCADIAAEAVFVAVRPLQSVRLSSLLARAPPTICL